MVRQLDFSRASACRGQKLMRPISILLLSALLLSGCDMMTSGAAWVLAPLHTSLAPSDLASFSRASDEFIASHELMADRPENRSTLGTFLGLMGRHDEAETQFLAAIRLSPRFGPAYVNLADLYRVSNREADARRILVQGLEAIPDDPSLHHSLGLALARAGELQEAVGALSRASALAPDNARYTYAYAVALHSSGEVSAAIRTLGDALERHPNDRDILVALSTFHRDEGLMSEAVRYAELLSEAYPLDPQVRALLTELRGGR
jgi:Flp pilus assembly protein TadD